MAHQMDEQQRLAALEAYNPAEHLISVGKDRAGNATMYLPAAWRLYELGLRYPNATFESEILIDDPERNFLAIKARLYIGESYAQAKLKSEATKQGNRAILDKVETGAQARAARLPPFCISTEYALDMDEETTQAEPVQQVATSNKQQPPATLSDEETKTLTGFKAEIGKLLWECYLTEIGVPLIVKEWTAAHKKLALGKLAWWNETGHPAFLGRKGTPQVVAAIKAVATSKDFTSAMINAYRIDHFGEVTWPNITNDDLLTAHEHLMETQYMVALAEAALADSQYQQLSDLFGKKHPLELFFKSVDPTQQEEYLTYIVHKAKSELVPERYKKRFAKDANLPVPIKPAAA